MSLDTHHSLQKKILPVLLVLGTVLVLGFYFILTLYIYPAFEEFEAEESLVNLSRVDMAIDAQYESLSVFGHEYALWDDTYAVIDQPDEFPSYIEANGLFPQYWGQIDVGMMLFYNRQNQLVWGSIIDPDDRVTALPPDEQLHTLNLPDHSLVSHDGPYHDVQGLIELPAGVMLIVSHPILKSDETGPVNGSVVVGRFLTPYLIEKIGDSASLEFQVYLVDEPKIPPAVRDIHAQLSASTADALTEYTKEKTYTYKLLPDVTGAALLILQVSADRRVGAIGDEATKMTLLFLLLIIILFILFEWRLLNSLIIEPISTLKKRIGLIRETGDLTSTLANHRNDEIGDLAKEFDELTTELSQAYIELRTARDQALETTRAKSQFLATMSHEIRTPMNGVLGMAELLKQTDLNSHQDSLVQNIQTSGDLLLNVIDGVLDISKMESGNLFLETREFNLRELVEKTMGLMVVQAHTKNLKLAHSLKGDTDQMFIGDPNRIYQVMVNLIGNAIKFTDQGEIIVAVSVFEQDDDLRRVRIAVSDTGIGISPEQHEKIFLEFSQVDNSASRQFGGTGLGLSISKRLLDLMAGKIGLDSEPGKGSCFWFEIPLKAVAQPSSGTQEDSRHPIVEAVEAEGSFIDAEVLLVEDNVINQEVARIMLEKSGCRVAVAANGVEALSILDEKGFDLILMDCQMPDMDGFEATIRIRQLKMEHEKRTTIIALTADVLEDVRERCQAAGMDDFLAKPFTWQQLHTTLQTWLPQKTVS